MNFVNFGTDEMKLILPLLRRLRSAGIVAELYPEPAKMKKQMTYANNLHIPYVAFVGAEEIAAGPSTSKTCKRASR